MGKSIRCLIVDTDPEARSDLVAHLAAHAEIQVLAAVKTVAEVIPLLSLVPDVIFLDTSLAELSKLAALSAGLPPYLTVALATPEKGALAATVPDASDVLLKPYAVQQVSITVTKLRLLLGGGAVLSADAPPVEAFKVAGRSDDLLVKMDQVSLIKAEGNYSRLTQSNGTPQLIRRTLVAWSKQLANTTFFRVDRFTFINLAHVVSFQRTSRDRARFRLKGVKEPLLLGRRAILRLDQRHPARLALALPSTQQLLTQEITRPAGFSASLSLAASRVFPPKRASGPEKRPIPEAELRQRIIHCPNLSSLQSNITALAKLFRNQRTPIEEFSKIISQDPPLTARLLRMANSAFFGLNAQINTIDGAVLHLGLSSVRLLMTTAPLIEDLEITAKDGMKVSWREFWMHSLGCAYATREILNQFDRRVDNDTDYLSGLLHNLGKLVIAQVFPAEFTQRSQPLYQDEAQVLVAERELLGWDHAAIGAFFLETHLIPLEVIEAVRYHHDSLSAPHHQAFAAATQLADIMVHQAGLKGGPEKRPIRNERELMELPCLVQLWPHKGPLLNLKMRKLTASIARLPDLCKTLLSES
jgi:HD-like signal output (HDOD) protein/DNA-binding LytR/AlgR family response regulator